MEKKMCRVVPNHVSASSDPYILAEHIGATKMDCTTTSREHFKPPVFPEVPRARRRDILKDFFLREIAQEFFNEVEQKEEETMANSKSSYKEDFKVDGFVAKDPLEMADTEMFAKYPLYSDMAQTIYWSKLDRIKGKAVSPNPMAAFRKTSHFAKKWYDELE